MQRYDLGETDRIIVLYTQALGKIKAVAKGIRNPKSRKSGHLELGSLVNLVLSQGKTFYYIDSVTTDHYFRHITLPQIEALFHWLKLINSSSREGEINNDFFNLAVFGINASEEIEKKPWLTSLSEIELYSAIGYGLNTTNCVIGHEALKAEPAWLSVAQGGVICRDHIKNQPKSSALPISINALKVLRFLDSEGLKALPNIRLSDEVASELTDFASTQRHEIFSW